MTPDPDDTCGICGNVIDIDLYGYYVALCSPECWAEYTLALQSCDDVFGGWE